MSEVSFEGQRVSLNFGETVLEGLERVGCRVPSSCRQGLCHACMLRSDDALPADSQQGLTDQQKRQGCFLSCSCRPAAAIRVERIGESDKVTATVKRKCLLNDTVLELSLSADVRWQPGQTLLLWKDEYTSRPYSIASHPQRERILILHIRLLPGGQLSSWCHHSLQQGDSLRVSRPSGDFVYDSSVPPRPLLLAATGTGLAPLYGILQDALAVNHSSPIHLYAAAGEASGLYLRDELESLARRHAQLNYVPVIRRGNSPGCESGDLIDVVLRRHRTLYDHRVYLCGSPTMVESLGKRCFLAGANRKDIFSDPFEFNHS